MDSLALRELRQLGVGYLLLLFTLKALVHLALAGGHGIFEHPAMPEEPGKASVWRLPLVRFLLSCGDFRMVTLAQGLWGAPTPKPTAKHLRPWQPATSDGDWTGRSGSVGYDQIEGVPTHQPYVLALAPPFLRFIVRMPPVIPERDHSREFTSQCECMEVTADG